MDEATREQFEQAVLASFNQSIDASYRHAAFTSLTQLKQADGGWRFCLDGLLHTQHVEVQFWCLQALCEVVHQGQYARFVAEDVNRLQAAVFAWLERVSASEPPFIKNKLAQLLIAMVEVDYPERWRGFFASLLNYLNQGGVAVDMFLRVLTTLHDEVLSAESGARTPERLPISTRIKDTMRAECMAHIVEAWYAILMRTATAGTHVELATQTLYALRLYVPWIDIALVANERLLPMLLGFVPREGLHAEACGVLCELVLKGMEPAPKLAHLRALRLTPTLAAYLDAADGRGGAARPSLALATLVSTLCDELLECWDKLPSDSQQAADAYSALQEALPLALACFGSDEQETSHVAVPFLNAYLGRLRRANLSAQALGAHANTLGQLLLALTRRMCYPPEYSFDEPDEPEEEFHAYRRDLATLFKAAARVDRERTLELTCELVQGVVKGCADVPFAHAECALFLLYQLGEGLPEAAFRMDDSHFTRMLVAVCASTLSAYPHRAVQTLYFELLVRYVRFFTSRPQFVGPALQALCDARGLGNADAEVRGRVCYLLLRFVKAMHQSMAPPAPSSAASGAGGGPGTGGGAGAGAGAGGGGGDDSSVASGSARQALQPYVETILLSMQAPMLAEPLQDEASQQQLSAATAAELGGPAPNGSAAEGEGGLRVSAAEQMHLFETAGVLLGGGLAPADVSARLLLLLLQPLSHALSLVRAEQLSADGQAAQPQPAAGGAGGGGEDEAAASAAAARVCRAAHIVGALGTLSKGFSHAHAQPVAHVFEAALEAALQTAAVLPRAAELRGRVLMLLHRMVECLGARVLPFARAAVPGLLQGTDGAELHEVVTLVNQLVTKFKARCHEQMVELLPHISARLLDSIGAPLPGALPTGTPLSEEERERVLLLRYYHSFVHGLVHNGLAAALVAPSNRGSMDTLLGVLVKGCVDAPDPQIQRQAVAALHKLVELWATGPTNGSAARADDDGADAHTPIPGFDAYALGQVAPAYVQALLHPYLNLKDASCLQLIEALASGQQALYTALGSQYTAFLADSALPALGCAPELVATYVQHVTSAPGSTLPTQQRPVGFRDFLREFAANYQASRQRQ